MSYIARAFVELRRREGAGPEKTKKARASKTQAKKREELLAAQLDQLENLSQAWSCARRLGCSYAPTVMGHIADPASYVERNPRVRSKTSAP